MTVLGDTRLTPAQQYAGPVAPATAPPERYVGPRALGVLAAGTDLAAAATPAILVAVGGAAAVPTLVLTLGWVVLLCLRSRPRLPAPRLRVADVLAPVWWTATTAAALGWAALVAIGASPDIHLAAALQLAVTAVLTGAARVALLQVPTAPTRVMLAGASRDVGALTEELRPFAPGWELTPCCVLEQETEGDGPLRAILGAAARHDADAVVTTAGTHLTPLELRRLTWGLRRLGADLLVPTGVQDVAPPRTSVLSPGPVGLVHVDRPGAAPAVHRLKHVLERGVAGLLLVPALPILAVVAATVRREDRGPVLYRHSRVGRDAVLFTMYKFRTMSPDADEKRAALESSNESDGGVLFKLRSDPRLTRVGGFLRRYSLDELPQLWNVVRGDMALIGPRPALPGEVQHYGVDAWHRLTVPPGITGLWQVSGRSDLSWEETLRLDLHYVDNWSWRLDLSVLLRTVTAVLGRRGAY